MGTSVKRDARRVKSQELRERALQLRKRGHTYRQVAKWLNVTLAYAHELVQTAIAEIPLEAAKDVRQLELDRIDRMLSGIWPKASAGDARAIEATLRLMERRARYLGLDAPTKTELTGNDGAPVVMQISANAARAFDDQEPRRIASDGDASSDDDSKPDA